MSIHDVGLSIKQLNDGERYALLKQHITASRYFIFPVSYIAGCNRSFKQEWMTEFPWLAYSEHFDGGFCLPCALFSNNREKLRVLLNRPFTQWQKKSETLKKHNARSYHHAAVELSNNFAMNN